MNESLETNETAGVVPWIEASDGNRSLELSTEPLDFPINPWDIMLCMSGTVIACENAIVVAIIFYTPTLRTPMHAHQIALQQHFFRSSHYLATKKGVSTLAIILGTFGASWLPFAIYCLVGAQMGDEDRFNGSSKAPPNHHRLVSPIMRLFTSAQLKL
ncbi:hypothetical protein AAFF_G00436240 [Aldrovandia affinis]|uniref:Uncharacterized protein n=1 Tax=Aldrovandia affinis TaxID=143900 RepID=A0AAD7S7X3_9TELE|nr:hypothetical protein AAFF_G00436240 [Aldrovandia affinis]